MLTKPMKRLMYKFGMTVNPALLMRNRKALIKLVKTQGSTSTESELVKHKEIRSMTLYKAKSHKIKTTQLWTCLSQQFLLSIKKSTDVIGNGIP